MFSFKAFQVSTCIYLLLVVIAMSSAYSIQKTLSIPVHKPTTEIQINVNEPHIVGVTEMCLESYAEDKSYEPILVKINSATKQISSNLIYRVNATFGETNCAKGQKTNCELKPNGEIKNANIGIIYEPETNTTTFPCNF